MRVLYTAYSIQYIYIYHSLYSIHHNCTLYLLDLCNWSIPLPDSHIHLLIKCRLLLPTFTRLLVNGAISRHHFNSFDSLRVHDSDEYMMYIRNTLRIFNYYESILWSIHCILNCTLCIANNKQH